MGCGPSVEGEAVGDADAPLDEDARGELEPVSCSPAGGRHWSQQEADSEPSTPGSAAAGGEAGEKDAGAQAPLSPLSRKPSRVLETAETEVLYHKRKKPIPKRRSASIQRKSGSSLPVIHQVPCTMDVSMALRRREKRRSIAEMIGLFRRSGDRGGSRRQDERARSLEDIRRESSTAWILSASHGDAQGRTSRESNRRNSVSVVLSEMTARDILTDNMLENRMQEIREANSNQFSSVSEMEVRGRRFEATVMTMMTAAAAAAAAGRRRRPGRADRTRVALGDLSAD